MSNMSYCRFRNTLEDFIDCTEALEEEGMPESDEEVRAAEDMAMWASRYLEAYEAVKEE